MNPNNKKSNIKAFVIISAFLAIFGSLVYSSNNVETLDSQASKPNYKKTQATVQEQDADATSQDSPFKKLAEGKPNVQSPAVLQANTDDGGTMISGTDGDGNSPGMNASLASGAGPQSSPSVPSTGNTSISLALLLSSIALALGMIIIAKNPRKLALARFEKQITKKL